MAREIPAENFEIDNLDRQIVSLLLAEGRTSYSDIAKQLGVSDGTIHVRMNKLKQAGAVRGTRLEIDPEQFGFGVSAFLGVNLEKAKDRPRVTEKLKAIPEVTEIFFTTGDFNLFIRVFVSSIERLYSLLADTIQEIDGVHSTDTTIVLNTALQRELQIDVG